LLPARRPDVGRGACKLGAGALSGDHVGKVAALAILADRLVRRA